MKNENMGGGNQWNKQSNNKSFVHFTQLEGINNIISSGHNFNSTEILEFMCMNER